MNLLKVSTYINQFGVLSAIRFLLSDLAIKIIDPHRRRSYSQVGEDIALNWFVAKSDGFYVDVGCNHPIRYSNTFNLYKNGWKGICVDANEKLIAKHKRLRIRDSSVCAVISDQEREVVFTDFVDPLISSLDTVHVASWKTSRPILGERTVRTKTLNAILTECDAPHIFDLLSIDVEGHDYEVLLSIDLDIYHPKLILVEMHGFDIHNPGSNRIYSYLTSSNYRLSGFLIMNGYFVLNEKATFEDVSRMAS